MRGGVKVGLILVTAMVALHNVKFIKISFFSFFLVIPGRSLADTHHQVSWGENGYKAIFCACVFLSMHDKSRPNLTSCWHPQVKVGKGSARVSPAHPKGLKFKPKIFLRLLGPIMGYTNEPSPWSLMWGILKNGMFWFFKTPCRFFRFVSVCAHTLKA
jgi:hypothetical protein